MKIVYELIEMDMMGKLVIEVKLLHVSHEIIWIVSRKFGGIVAYEIAFWFGSQILPKEIVWEEVIGIEDKKWWEF